MNHIININLTNYCQSKCVACPRTNTDTLSAHSWLPIKHTDIQDVRKVIKNICRLATGKNKVHLKLCGDYGDPMMHPDIEYIIYEAHLHPEITKISIATNGGLRNEKFYKSIALKYNKLRITFGIDGTTDEMNQKYREGVNFNKAWNNMLTFYEYSKSDKCEWQYLVFQWNVDDMENAFRIAKETGVPLDVHRGNGTFADIPENLVSEIDQKIEKLYDNYMGDNR